MEAHDDGEKQNPNFLSPDCVTVKKLERLKIFSYEDLKLYTNNFSAENFIGEFQFGKVYRGFINGQEVTVKIWEWEDCLYIEENNEFRMRDEVYLLKHPKFESHPNLVKLIGYCFGVEGNHVGVVYDLKSLDNVRNLVLKDNLSWFQRIKVALGFAGLVRYFHAQDPPYLPHLIRNINAAHMMLDQDYNLKFYDFSMISGGIFPDKANYPFQLVHGCYGYADWYSYLGAKSTEEADVFGYGVVLLALISNRVVIERNEDRDDSGYPYEWAKDEYKPRQSIWCFGRGECSLVHASLVDDPFFYPSDGRKLTKLAMQCVEDMRWDRPTMDEVINCLLKLHVVRHYGKALGIDQLLHGRVANVQKSN